MVTRKRKRHDICVFGVKRVPAHFSNGWRVQEFIRGKGCLFVQPISQFCIVMNVLHRRGEKKKPLLANKNQVLFSACTSYSKLENSTSFTTQISNFMKFGFNGLYFWESRTRLSLKYLKCSSQNSANSPLNSRLSSKSSFSLNSICVQTQTFQTR